MRFRLRHWLEVPALPVDPPADASPRFLNESERRFLLATVERLIPADEKWPGAAGAGVVNYIDLQMAGQWGKGELLYRHGPFRKGTPSQGYRFLPGTGLGGCEVHWNGQSWRYQVADFIYNHTSNSVMGTDPGSRPSNSRLKRHLPGIGTVFTTALSICLEFVAKRAI